MLYVQKMADQQREVLEVLYHQVVAEEQGIPLGVVVGRAIPLVVPSSVGPPQGEAGIHLEHKWRPLTTQNTTVCTHWTQLEATITSSSGVYTYNRHCSIPDTFETVWNRPKCPD